MTEEISEEKIARKKKKRKRKRRKIKTKERYTFKDSFFTLFLVRSLFKTELTPVHSLKEAYFLS